MISFTDFKKMELRVAEIKEAEIHPQADKLLVLKIDLGGETKQVVAGIRGHYSPEELIGRQVVAVANLESATIRGTESQGMLLAAHDEGKIVLLAVEKPVKAGSSIS